MYNPGEMNLEKLNNIDGTPLKSEMITHAEGQQINRQLVLQHFPPEFVEKHKQNFLFTGVIQTLIKGISPYMIIQELLETLTDVNIQHPPL